MNIIIVGGGFGGVRAARKIASDTKHKVTLISDKADFQYYPALYGAATGRSGRESWFSLATLLADVPNVEIVIDRVEKLVSNGRYVVGQSGTKYHYQRCVFALGSVTTYFGIKGLDEHAFGIKSKQQVDQFKQHLYKEIQANRPAQKRNIVVVGGGPTGVEFAASLPSYIRQVEKRLGLRKQGYKIHLIEAAPLLLPTVKGTGKTIKRRLERLGIKVQIGAKVESASSIGVTIDGQFMDSKTIVWTSGVAVNPFYSQNADQFEFGARGRVAVNQYLQSSRYVYVIGDNADTPYSGLAQVATEHADVVADNLARLGRDKKLKAYKPKLPPVVIPVGEKYALFSWGKIRLYGWLPALIRRAADIIGYSEILGLRRALAVSQWSEPFEDEYFLLDSK